MPKLKEKLQRAYQFEIHALDTEDGTFAGYASVWGKLENRPDVLHPGAFTKTLAERGHKVKLLWQHWDDAPIGRILELREDEIGLWIRGKLSDTTQGRDALALLRDGAIYEMSIGFESISEEYDENGLRHLLEIKLWEVSLVSFPANERALVLDVHNAGNGDPEAEPDEVSDANQLSFTIEADSDATGILAKLRDELIKVYGIPSYLLEDNLVAVSALDAGADHNAAGVDDSPTSEAGPDGDAPADQQAASDAPPTSEEDEVLLHELKLLHEELMAYELLESLEVLEHAHQCEGVAGSSS